VGVADGDTVTLLDADKKQHRIRLAGIDAPERGQSFADRSKQTLADLAFDRDAQAHCPKVDRYKRRVCKVTVGGVDVGLEQIQRGMAWHFKRYEREQSPQDRTAYSAAETEARSEGRGLWRDREPVAPWEWRTARLPVR
jgi:endonuclease YncB( thermonuclease family)